MIDSEPGAERQEGGTNNKGNVIVYTAGLGQVGPARLLRTADSRVFRLRLFGFAPAAVLVVFNAAMSSCGRWWH